MKFLLQIMKLGVLHIQLMDEQFSLNKLRFMVLITLPENL